jgi:hypothetical protein
MRAGRSGQFRFDVKLAKTSISSGGCWARCSTTLPLPRSMSIMTFLLLRALWPLSALANQADLPANSAATTNSAIYKFL